MQLWDVGGTLQISTYDYNWTNITPGDSTITDIDVSELATPTNRQYIPGDLIEDNVVTIEYQYDSASVQIPLKTLIQLRIIWPLGSTETTPAELRGTGYFNSNTPSALATDELQTGTTVFKFDGGQAGIIPTWIPAT